MKTKIVGILVIMLMTATAFPAVGTLNEKNHITPTFEKQQRLIHDTSYPLHDLVVEWEHLYGGPNEDLFRYVKQTTDGGYITVGVWNSTSHWLAKFDATGTMEWNTTALPNTTLWPRCYIVEQTSDGGYVTAGCHEDNLGFGYDRCIWKVDANGNTEWCKIYDDPLYGYHMCIQQTTDYGYIVSGEIDVAQGDWDVLLMKTDSTGNTEWQQIYKYGTYGENAYAVRQTTDGGYILAGRLETSSALADMLVIKTDSTGNVEWDQTYGGQYWEWTQANDILLTSDGGYIFLGETNSYGIGSRDIWLFKTDAAGNMEWNRTFGEPNWEMGGGMDFTSDGGIILTGTLNAMGGSAPRSQGLVIKTDENGILEWQHTFGDDNYDQLQAVCSTNDGGYIVAGAFDSTATTGAGLYDGWLIKIEEFSNNPPDKPAKPSGKKRVNPNTAYTYTSSTDDSDGDELYYQWDWGDGNFSEWLGPYNSGETVEAENSWQNGGQYNVKVCAKDKHSALSDWSESLPYNIPGNNAFTFIHNLLERLCEQYPNAFPLLRYMLGF